MISLTMAASERSSLGTALRRGAFLAWAGLRAAGDFGPATTARIAAATTRDALVLGYDAAGSLLQRSAGREAMLPGVMRSVDPARHGGHFSFDHAELEVAFLAPDVVRVTWGPGPEPLSYALGEPSQAWQVPEVVLRQGGLDGSDLDLTGRREKTSAECTGGEG